MGLSHKLNVLIFMDAEHAVLKQQQLLGRMTVF